MVYATLRSSLNWKKKTDKNLPQAYLKNTFVFCLLFTDTEFSGSVGR